MRYAILIMIAMMILFTSCTADKAQPNSVSDAVSQIQEPDEAIAETTDNKNIKTFKIIAEDYKFVIDGADNPEIRVKKGDNIRVELTSIQGSHNWNVNQLAARTKTVMTNESTTLEFTAHTAGTFNYYCAVGIHERRGMKGVFIVEE